MFIFQNFQSLNVPESLNLKIKKSNAQLFFFSFVQVPDCAHCTLSFFSLVHAPECAYCTSILYICHIIQFCLYITLAKDGSYHINLVSLFYTS